MDHDKSRQSQTTCQDIISRDKGQVPNIGISRPQLSTLAIVQRAVMEPYSLTPADVMQLQKMIGNGAVGWLLDATAARKISKEEEEASVQGKFETVQRVEETPPEVGEEPLRMKMENKTVTPDKSPTPMNGKILQLARAKVKLTHRDLTRKAQHTAAVLKIPDMSKKYYFTSGGGLHAEDKVIKKVKALAKQGLLGSKQKEVDVEIKVTKSPCASASGDYVATTNKDEGCTQELINNRIISINGYTIVIKKVKVFRIYTPQVSGAKKASINAINELRNAGIKVEHMGSDDSDAGERSDNQERRNWSIKQGETMK